MSWKTGPDVPGTVKRPLQAASSLATRLTVWYAGTAFATVLVTSTLLYLGLVQNFNQEDDEALHERASACLQAWPDPSRLQQEVNRDGEDRFPHISVRILDGTRIVAETPGMTELPVSWFPAVSYQPGMASSASYRQGPDGRTYRALSINAPNTQSLVVQAALDRTGDEEVLTRYRRHLGTVLLAALCFSAFAGYGLARHGLRPLGEITATARKIRTTNLSARITIEKLPAELADLADTFNDMLARLEESFDRLSRFSADIAHELRTPVHTLRGEAELALSRTYSAAEYRDVLGSCLEESQRLAKLIDALLFIARAETPDVQIEREPVVITEELRAVQEFYEPLATETGITLTLDAPERLMAELDRTLFQRALCNLTENALRYTPRDGRVTLTAWKEEQTIKIAVTDTGSGIAAEHLPRIFDRFHRGDQSRSPHSGGAGLGLSLVKSIAALHSGSVEIESEPGRGTRVTISVPVTGSALDATTH